MSTACCKLLSGAIGGFRGGAEGMLYAACPEKLSFHSGGVVGGRLGPLFLNFLDPPLRVQIILQRIIPCYGTV